jgi:outer membrane protein TolC
MKFKSLIFIGCLVLLQSWILAGQSDTSSVWSLRQIIDLGLENALNPKAAAFRYIAAQYDYQQTQSLFRPWMNIDGNLPNYTRTVQEIIQPDGSIEFQPIQYNNSALGLSISQEFAATGGRLFLDSDIQRFDNFASDKTNYNGLPVRIGYEQPLFQFNPLKWSKQLAPLRQTLAINQYLANLEEFSVDIVREYFKLISVQLNYEISQVNLENNDTLYRIALERYELGKISQNDLLQLKRESIQAKKELNAATVDLINAREKLTSFIGTASRLDGRFRLPERPDLKTIDYQLAVEKARSNRPEKMSYLLQEMESKMELDRAKKSNAFQANIIASAGLVRSASTFSEIYRDPQNEQALSLRFRVPILNWGYNRASIKKQEAFLEYTREEITQLDRDFQLSVVLLCRNLENSVVELQLASELNDIARERYTISKNRYLFGDISITDLTLSLREKDAAQREYVRALETAWLDYYSLRALTLYDFITNQDIKYSFPNL